MEQELPIATFAGVELIQKNSVLKWAITLPANVASFVILDVFATVVGIAVVQFHPFADVNTSLAVALLVGSYAFWLLGLNNAIQQNERLLKRTGVSTSALSKFAYDTSSKMSNNKRIQKYATATGYVAWELLKEIPYYVAAFAPIVASTLPFIPKLNYTLHDALAFLAGANIAAGLYEYGLALITKQGLQPSKQILHQKSHLFSFFRSTDHLNKQKTRLYLKRDEMSQ